MDVTIQRQLRLPETGGSRRGGRRAATTGEFLGFRVAPNPSGACAEPPAEDMKGTQGLLWKQPNNCGAQK